MPLVQPLLVLFVVLSSSAWAAPTQAELPGSWTAAALTAGWPAPLHQGRCASSTQGRVVMDCDPVGTAPGGGCLPVQRCQRLAVPSLAEQINVAFSNAPADSHDAPARKCARGAATALTTASASGPARPRGCTERA
ncbi:MULTISPECIES: hypothetical protein [Xanthomonas]|uniref:Uncharacterized protein n=1 Tax=Xanthomonas cucurbitae TaxID=56453 RepID=A0A2S7DIK4_9XANT|nr:hypothetical protein [Xanthomonas cucurbitae]PPU73620.1 hypothetical protein XcuCFBP2542_16350 [Xanthomonas cucurbitae]QHG85770.1 hypothetical protein EBN15_01015 [Xanthomonas cucurbitae]WDM67485.1 hypothetical protein K6981_18830 [Xanthomonas cucurbitae]WDM71361.1 hypothetical protein K6978_18795 [Xanthomonas cucurbitae]WDM75663.1 hypothetical protein K6982_00985 [Xanthomonas cucurbitae]